MNLTAKQKNVYDFIVSFDQKNGRCPSNMEIAKHFGFSKVTAHEYVQILQEKEVITKPAYAHYGMEILDTKLPLLGKVAAGRPIEHLKHNERIEVPASMLKGPGPYFALQVSGDSMIQEGILEGDYVIIKKREHAENRDIVVALIENEATIKRFYQKKNHIELHSANEKYAPILVRPDQEFRIAGIYCGLIRY